MTGEDCADGLVERHGEEGYVYPAYGDYCFANVPGTVYSLLGGPADLGPGGERRRLPDDAFAGVGTDVDRVVVLLVDGLGYDHFRREREDHALLSALSSRGRVTPLTSVYPSETAAAMTTLHTGLLPAEHGLLGWNQYVESYGAVVQALPYTTREDRPVDDVLPDADPRELFAGESHYGRARAAGVDARVVQPSHTTGSPYAERALDGADVRPYESVPGLAARTREAVAGADGPTYVLAYAPQVDEASHLAGTRSPDCRGALSDVLEAVRRELLEGLDAARAGRTLLAVTADHGMVDTRPPDNVDLREVEGVYDSLRRADGDSFPSGRGGGDPIPPAGSGRNLHLYLREGTVEAVREAIERAPFEAATFTREEAFERGLFGPVDPGDTARERCGDLVVAPRDRIVWDDPEALEYVGMHGGLARAEMLVPFVVGRIADLRT